MTTAGLPAAGLTDREAEVLLLTGEGLTATAVGHLLGISARTVTKHLEHSYRKLGCDNKVSALRRLAEGPFDKLRERRTFTR